MLTAKEARKLSDTGIATQGNTNVENVLNGVSEKISQAASAGLTFIVYDFFCDHLTQEEKVGVIVHLQNAGYDVHRFDYPAQIWIQW